SSDRSNLHRAHVALPYQTLGCSKPGWISSLAATIQRHRALPSAWEAGIGEFMHGPENTPDPEYESGPRHTQFPHFTENGLPDLFLFLKNAVAEELGYHEAQQENFCLYGFAVEYETLAPKLLVVYHANCTIATLLESAKKAKDRARELSSLELTPRAIAKACSSSRYSSWGPT